MGGERWPITHYGLRLFQGIMWVNRGCKTNHRGTEAQRTKRGFFDEKSSSQSLWFHHILNFIANEPFYSGGLRHGIKGLVS
jgi:hypothetical protein